MTVKTDRPRILCLIPARGGSKGLPRKNLRTLLDKPLLAYSIEQALGSSLISRTIVSTDDPEIAQVAQHYGAEVPFIRPAELAADSSTDLEVFEHALRWLSDNEEYVAEICVHLRATHPIRRVEDIDRIIDILLSNQDIDSVRSIARAPETPFKMWFRGNDGLLENVMQTPIQEAHSMPRQLLPEVFLQNASIDAVRTKVITEKRSMAGTKIYGYLMDDSFDIDTESDLERAREYLLENM